MSSFTLLSSIGIVLNCFYLLIFYFVKFSTFYLSLSFSVCRSGDSKSLYWSDVSAAYRARRFSLGHSADVQSWTISITLVLSWSCLVKFFQPVENSSDAVWTKSPSQPFFWMSNVTLTWQRVPQDARALVAIPSNTVKSKLFTRGPLSFFLGFGRDLHMAKTVSQSDFKIQSGIAFSKFYSVYSFWSVKKQLSWGNEFRVSILK